MIQAFSDIGTELTHCSINNFQLHVLKCALLSCGDSTEGFSLNITACIRSNILWHAVLGVTSCDTLAYWQTTPN